MASAEISLHHELVAPPDLLPAYRCYLQEIGACIADLGLPWSEPHPWWLDRSRAEVLVAQLAGATVGFCILGWGDQVDPDVDAEICELWVEPQWRGAGIGSRLVDAALARLPARAGLQAYAANAAALTFWRRVFARRGLAVEERAAVDGRVPVLRFRFRGGAPTD